MDITNAPTTDDNNELVEDTEVPFDDGFDTFLKQFEAEEFNTTADAAIKRGEVDDGEGDSKVETEVVTPPADTAKPDEAARGLERVAAKEKELRTEIEKFESQKKAFEAERANFKGIDAAMLTEQMMFYPEKVIASLGLDADVIMKTLLVSKLPDTNPAKAKLKGELKDLENKREVRSLRAEIAAKERKEQSDRQYREAVESGEKYVDSLTKEDSEQVKTLPTVSRLAKANSKFAHALITREILEDARERHYVRGETGNPLTYEEAAKRVETDLAELSKYLVSENAAVAQKTETKQPTNNNSKIVPSTPVKVRKEKTIKDQEEEAINNAVAEFYRLEKRTGFSGNR
jgi:hypothetical protein